MAPKRSPIVAIALGVVVTVGLLFGLQAAASAQTTTAPSTTSAADQGGAALSHTGGLPVVAAAVGLLVVIGIGGALMARLARRSEPHREAAGQLGTEP